ncbi:MAG TPA: glycerophosphodiester phosphodiesterase [Ramlibacter sp.]|nr:glycerophosphodiester phosphodiesterase [Ramlibacter sp.]
MTPAWPYPKWIAHRGAGKLAPENTLAAFRLGAAHGYRMFECDVQLSADKVPFLLHDAALERTTNGVGRAADQPWDQLALLDAGSWHSRRYAGEPLPSFENVARFCLANGHLLNIELKPSPGAEVETGTVVARYAERIWQGQAVPPLLTSFSVEALQAAMGAVPALPRGLLLDGWWDGWLEAARGMGCVAVVCEHTLWDPAAVVQVQGAGMRCLGYTVNDEVAARRLMGLGIDGVITDRVDLFVP